MDENNENIESLGETAASYVEAEGDAPEEYQDDSGACFFIGLMLGVIAMLILFVTVYKPLLFRSEKHTGPVVVVSQNGETFQMLRPNREFFEMKFDEHTSPVVCTGAKFDDIVYKDVDTDTRHFIKATVAVPPEQDTVVDAYGRVFKLVKPK